MKNWIIEFERTKLTKTQMLALKHQEDAPRPTKPTNERGTAKPSSSQLLALYWKYNQDKPSWL